MSRKKRVKIPFKPYLVKFLRAEYSWKTYSVHGQETTYLQLNPRLWKPKFSNRKWSKAFWRQPHADKIWLDVETVDTNLEKLWLLKNQLEDDFYNRMIGYAAARYGIMDSWGAIKQFLDQYGITESDYSMDSAYKRWQRSKTYKNLKKNVSNRQVI